MAAASRVSLCPSVSVCRGFWPKIVKDKPEGQSQKSKTRKRPAPKAAPKATPKATPKAKGKGKK